MKQALFLIMTALLMAVGGTAAKVERNANLLVLPRCSNVNVVKELRQVVLTPDPIMHCQSCEDKIKGELRFEKGVVKIETDRERQTVTITYDPKKTNVEKLQAAMKKIGRDTKVVSDKPVVKDKKQKR